MADAVTYKTRLHDQLRRLDEQRSAVAQAFAELNPKNKRIVIVAIAVLVLAVGTVGWWRARSNNGSSFVATEVKRGNVTSSITAAGTIEPLEVVDVGAQVAGQISAFGTDKAGKQIDYRSVVAADDV